MGTGPSTVTERTHPLNVVVIGRGRLGYAISIAMGAAPPISHGSVHEHAVPDAYVLAVPDGAINAVAAQLPIGAAVGHCSGALGLEVLEPHRERFSLHPLMTLTGDRTAGAERLRGAGAAIASSDPSAHAIVIEIAARAGLRAFPLRASDRPLYHAAASIASNFLVTLEGLAEQLFAEVGVPREHLGPLARASLENWQALGAREALSGPIARGDSATVALQTRALELRAPRVLPAFQALADATRELAAP